MESKKYNKLVKKTTGKQTTRCREVGHVKIKAEIRLMLSQAEGHQGLSAATRSCKMQGEILP